LENNAIVEKHAKDIEGEKENGIVLITLSTCMWCKKCKRYLQDHKMKYKYIDVDLIPSEDKAKILEYLRENYQSRISYPFLICDNGFVVGYDTKKYEELMMAGEM